jgi:hypothetical protein
VFIGIECSVSTVFNSSYDLTCVTSGQPFLLDNLPRIRACEARINQIPLSSSIQLIYEEEKCLTVLSLPIDMPRYELLEKELSRMNQQESIVKSEQDKDQSDIHHYADAVHNSSPEDKMRKAQRRRILHTPYATNQSILDEQVHSIRFHIQLLFDVSDGTILTMNCTIPVLVFPNQNSLDRVRGDLREYGRVTCQQLPTIFKPVKLFGYSSVHSIQQHY